MLQITHVIAAAGTELSAHRQAEMVEQDASDLTFGGIAALFRRVGHGSGPTAPWRHREALQEIREAGEDAGDGDKKGMRAASSVHRPTSLI